MSRRVRDLTGQKFGRLTAVQMTELDHTKRMMWLCECECGEMVEIVGTALTRGNTRSCGCLRKQAQRERRARERGGTHDDRDEHN